MAKLNEIERHILTPVRMQLKLDMKFVINVHLQYFHRSSSEDLDLIVSF